MIRRIFGCIVFAVLLFGNGASAHHNMTALFDFNDRVTVTGTLTKIDWRNPHIYLTIDVKNAKGAMENWQGEGPCAVLVPHPRRRQSRFREKHREDAYPRTEPRARQVAVRIDPNHHVAGWQGHLRVSAELLNR